MHRADEDQSPVPALCAPGGFPAHLSGQLSSPPFPWKCRKTGAHVQPGVSHLCANESHRGQNPKAWVMGVDNSMSWAGQLGLARLWHSHQAVSEGPSRQLALVLPKHGGFVPL